MPVGTRATGHEDLPNLRAARHHAVGIEAQHGGAAAELAGDFREEPGVLHCRRIETYFFCARLNEAGGVVEGSDSSADGQRHEDIFHDPRDQVGHDLTALVGGGNVVKDQFVRAVGLISLRLFDRIAGINVVKKLDAFDHPSPIDIKAGDDAFGEHERGAVDELSALK